MSSITTNTRRRRNKEEDRLSTLPDAILTEILSLLPITSAASTSVLSHRWRQLWTGVTRLHFCAKESEPEFTGTIKHILRQLTSRKLRVFDLDFSDINEEPDRKVVKSCFREVLRRDVEQLVINSGDDSDANLYFQVPVCVFKSKSLVSLELMGLLKIKLPENGNIHLPNLKTFSLGYLLRVPAWFKTLYKSCPLLEHLDLRFNMLELGQPKNGDYLVNLIFPNLKSLKIRMISWTHIRPTKFRIDAPKLEYLELHDCFSLYYFLRYPTSLVKAVAEG